MPLSRSLKIPDNAAEAIKKFNELSFEDIDSLIEKVDEYTIYSTEDLAESEEFSKKFANGLDSNGILITLYGAVSSAKNNNISLEELAIDFEKQINRKFPDDDTSDIRDKLLVVFRRFWFSILAKENAEAGQNKVVSIEINTNERSITNQDGKVKGYVLNYDIKFDYHNGQLLKSSAFSLSYEELSGLATIIDEVMRNREIIIASRDKTPMFRYFGEE
jgi:hypothetical protein